MAYPNLTASVIVISQTSGSAVGGQYPFLERQISGSNLFLVTDSSGFLTGSTSIPGGSFTNLTVTGALTASVISASTAITAAAILDTGALTVTGLLSASGNITASNIYDAGTLTVLGLTNAQTISAVSISASSNISASTGWYNNLTVANTIVGTIQTASIANALNAANTYSVNTINVTSALSSSGTSTLGTTNVTGLLSASNAITASAVNVTGNTTATTITASNISASGTISASQFYGAFSGTITTASYANALNQANSYAVTNLTASGNISASGTVSASAGWFSNLTVANTIVGTVQTASYANALNPANTYTGSAFSSSGTSYFATLTSSNVGVGSSLTVGSVSTFNGAVTVNNTISASGNISSSTAWHNTLNVAGTSTLATVNATNISASGNVTASNLYVSGSTTIGGDLTILGTSSIINISSSTVIIGDNRILLNAYPSAGTTFPQRYAGVDVYDSGSTFAVTSSILWDSQNNYWLLQTNNSSSAPLVTSSAIILQGPTSSFGSENLLTPNYFLKTQTTVGNMVTSSLSEVGGQLQYAGTISASTFSGSALSASNAFVGSTITAATGSFTTVTVVTGSSPGVGNAPANPTSAGMPGQIEVDNNFIYVYTNGGWKRVPLSVWTP